MHAILDQRSTSTREHRRQAFQKEPDVKFSLFFLGRWHARDRVYYAIVRDPGAVNILQFHCVKCRSVDYPGSHIPHLFYIRRENTISRPSTIERISSLIEEQIAEQYATVLIDFDLLLK